MFARRDIWMISGAELPPYVEANKVVAEAWVAHRRFARPIRVVFLGATSPTAAERVSDPPGDSSRGWQCRSAGAQPQLRQRRQLATRLRLPGWGLGGRRIRSGPANARPM
jgi:hypothetical protein